ncbi:MAG: bifunctional riboflavin kinase/FAD synthetase [Gammaproteobacteria bacterium]|nr:bifunctional riboflavin kinase/FAD synthetase [Gammaproteobacteria bacterium]
MQLIRGIHNIRPEHHGCVATIGNFDGVHLGHAEIIKRLRKLGAHYGVPSLVVLFEPQPAEFFRRGRVPARLSRLREKFHLIEARGIDRVLVLRFTEELAAMPPERFVEDILVRKLGLKALIIGDDFRFGSGRGGDYNLLHALSVKHDFHMEQTVPFLFIGKRISSTYVRDLLRQGYFLEATRMLGHPYFIEGRVVHGHKQGREWGFPTANLDLHRLKSPLSGIFAVKVHGLADHALPGVGYVGSRPTIEDPRFVFEVHIFDYNDDCYGKYIKVEFVDKIRDDIKFESFAAMAEQIGRDCESARGILAVAH